MTPAKARKEAQRVAADWEAEQKEAFERQKAQQEGHKTDYTFGQFVDEVWVPLCVRDGSHRPSTIAMYTNILKKMTPIRTMCFTRAARTKTGHEVVVRYIAGLTM